jgi:tetratricopeptide (TPR) repeat protein
MRAGGSHRWRRALGVAAVATAALIAPPALGQAPDKKAADTLFREGRAAFDKGDYATACAKFEASQAADPAPGTLLNLGVCEERMGKLVAAQRHLAELNLGAAGKRGERDKYADELRAKIEARIARLTLTLAPGAPTDTAARDAEGEAPLKLGEALPFDPGAHEIIVSASGRPEVRFKITLAEGARETREIAPGAAAEAPRPIAPLPDTSDDGRKLRRTLGFVAGGVGVAGLGLAITTGIVLESKKSALDKHCPNKQCDPTGVKLLADDRSTPLVAVNMVGWIAGVAGLGAGTVLLLTSRTPAPATGRVSPVFGPGYGGLAVDGRF